MECNLKCLLCFIVSTIWFTTNAQNSYSENLTNYDFLSEITDSLIEKSLADYFKKPGLVIVNAINQSDDNWFVEDRLLKTLIGYECQVYNQGTIQDFVNTSNQPVLKIDYKIINLGISYVADFSSNPERTLKRTATVNIYLKIHNQDTGQIIYNKQSMESKSDWISPDNISKLENENISFTRGVIIQTPASTKIFKAITISAATGIIVYLFYALRSR